MAPRVNLMRDAHLEDDAQEWHVIEAASAFDGDAWAPGTLVTNLRLFLYQPSPNWRRFGLNSLTVHVYSQPPRLRDGPAQAGEGVEPSADRPPAPRTSSKKKKKKSKP